MTVNQLGEKAHPIIEPRRITVRVYVMGERGAMEAGSDEDFAECGV